VGNEALISSRRCAPRISNDRNKRERPTGTKLVGQFSLMAKPAVQNPSPHQLFWGGLVDRPLPRNSRATVDVPLYAPGEGLFTVQVSLENRYVSDQKLSG
jgi:hypothetical protein